MTRDELIAIAREMSDRHGAGALEKIEWWSAHNRSAGEREAAEFWAAVAMTMRQLQSESPAGS